MIVIYINTKLSEIVIKMNVYILIINIILFIVWLILQLSIELISEIEVVIQFQEILSTAYRFIIFGFICLGL